MEKNTIPSSSCHPRKRPIPTWWRHLLGHGEVLLQEAQQYLSSDAHPPAGLAWLQLQVFGCCLAGCLQSHNDGIAGCQGGLGLLNNRGDLQIRGASRWEKRVLVYCE